MDNKLYYDAVIIDSGVSCNNKHMHNENGIYIKFQSPEIYSVLDDYNDNIGHGTQINGIIKKHCPCISAFNIKVYDNKDDYITCCDLILVLEYILKNINCKLINISMAIVMESEYEYIQKLEYICKKLKILGVIIVAAFDNMGSLSYPALLDSVIGVTSGENCSGPNDIEYIENSMINICAFGKEQSVLSREGGYIISNGNSLACAHVSGIIMNIINSGVSPADILLYLKKYSLKQYCLKQENCNIQHFNTKEIRKAVVFPFNKEIQTMIRFQDMLEFNVTGIYDTKYSGIVNSHINDLTNKSYRTNYVVSNIELIDINSFDSIIIGHTNLLEKIDRIEVLIKSLLLKCVQNEKWIYSLDERPYLSNYPRYYSPQVKKTMVNTIPQGKLYRNPKPVIGVFGTGSRQGKFSVQLIIRKHLIELGYHVGQIGSEPTSELFGMDTTFHFGYNSNIEINRYDTVLYLNNCINDIYKKKC